MKKIKINLSVLLSILMIFACTNSFAYSPVGGAYKSDYVSGNAESPYKAEVVFERQWENATHSFTKPIQWIENPAQTGQILATAYFTELPSDCSDAVFMVLGYKDDTLKYIATAPIDAETLMSTAKLVIQDNIDDENPIPEENIPDMISAHVWNSMDTIMPLTELKTITTASFRVNEIRIDSNMVDFTVDAGIGLIDAKTNELHDSVDLSDCTLEVELAYARNREMYGEDGRSAVLTMIDDNSGYFTLENVDLTDGEAIEFILPSIGCNAEYIINETGLYELDPDKYTVKSNGTEINPEIGSEERLLNKNFAFYDGDVKISDFHNNNFTSDVIASLSDHIYWSIYNDNGDKYLRMYNDGVGKDTIGAPDIFYGLFRFGGKVSEDEVINGNYVMEMKFRAKEVTDKHPDALNYESDYEYANDTLASFHFKIRGGAGSTATTELLNMKTSVYSRFKVNDATEFDGRLFTGSGNIEEDVVYKIRIYARKLDDGTTSYMYYTSRSNEDNGKFKHCVAYDDYNMQNANWIGDESTPADDAGVRQMRMGTVSGGGYSHDLYIDYIKFMEA